MRRVATPPFRAYSILNDSIAPPVESTLACSAAQFVVAQRERLRAGEQLRAVLQGRDPSWGVVRCAPDDVSAVLRSIASGDIPPCLSLIGRWYAMWSAEERRLLAVMAEAMRGHVVWPWLRHVRGVGPSLGAQLLARLDIDRAPHPASFWAYCGLGTVAVEDESGVHRIAAPRTPRGQSASYDHSAKRLCHLLGVSFVRKGAWYRLMYDLERTRLERVHGDWTPLHRHRAASRAATKLFLRDLWCAWGDLQGRTSSACPNTDGVAHAWNVARLDGDDPTLGRDHHVHSP